MKEGKKTGGFLMKQRAFLKLYLLRYIEREKKYGREFLDELQEQFKDFGYVPPHSEIYKVLHELTREELVKREKQIKGDPKHDFQEIIFYKLTEKGKEEMDLYRKQMKVELERCQGLIKKAIEDHYGPHAI